MNGPIAVARLFPAVDDNRFRQRRFEPFNKLILREDIFHDQSTSSDVLHLTQPNRFPPKLLDDGACRLRRPACRLEFRPLPNVRYDLFVCLGKGPTISIKSSEV